MNRNHTFGPASVLALRMSLALVFALAPFGVTRLTFSQTPSPEIPDRAATAGVSVLSVPAATRSSVSLQPAAMLGQPLGGEIEPNGAYTLATVISSGATIRGNIHPAGDVDYYAFAAQAGDRVYAATMTSFSAGTSDDSQLTLLATDGITPLEFDEDNGSLSARSSSIAGAVLAITGTYYLKISDRTPATGVETGYELHFRLQRSAPAPELEPNDTPLTASSLNAAGWMTGTHSLTGANEPDWFSMTLAAGDTVFLSLDLDPERDGTFYPLYLGFGLVGDAGNQIISVDDPGASESPAPRIPSEALFVTVKNAGTYYAFVDSHTLATGDPTATYNLSVDIQHAVAEGPVCAIYASADVPKALGPGNGLSSSSISVPGHPRIADLDVTVNLTHSRMSDLDVHLRSPQGNDNGLFADIGGPGQILEPYDTQMDTTFDDEAGTPPAFRMLKGLVFKPAAPYRLAWFDGEDAGGTWTLDLRDDTANGSGGTLLGWSMRICEPPPPPTCPIGYALNTIFSADFEVNNGGFTHTGTADEWAYGLPDTRSASPNLSIAPFTTCNSGIGCWKTDLTGTYELNSNQDLFSPNISLVTVTAPIQVSWAQRYQLGNAAYMSAFVDLRQVDGATPVRLWEWLDGEMTDQVGNPLVDIGASGGWGVRTARADSLAGLNTELRFHLDSPMSAHLGGLAVDDVTVQGCVAIPRYVFISRVLR